MVRFNDSRVTYFPLIEIESTMVVIKDSRWLYVIALVSKRKDWNRDFSVHAFQSTLARSPILREYDLWPKVSPRITVNSRVGNFHPHSIAQLPFGRSEFSYGSTSDSFLRQNDHTVGWVGEIYFMAIWWDVPGDIVIFFFLFTFFPPIALTDRNALFLSSM